MSIALLVLLIGTASYGPSISFRSARPVDSRSTRRLVSCWLCKCWWKVLLTSMYTCQPRPELCDVEDCPRFLCFMAPSEIYTFVVDSCCMHLQFSLIVDMFLLLSRQM